MPPILITGVLLAVLSPLPWARIVFVLAWAPLTAYLVAWGTAMARARPVQAWIVRAATTITASAASFGISQLAAQALTDAGGWLLPAAAAVAVAVAGMIGPVAWRHTSLASHFRSPAHARPATRSRWNRGSWRGRDRLQL